MLQQMHEPQIVRPAVEARRSGQQRGHRRRRTEAPVLHERERKERSDGLRDQADTERRVRGHRRGTTRVGMPEGSEGGERAVLNERVGASADAVLLREAHDVAVHGLDVRRPGDAAARDEHRPSRAHYAKLS